MWESINTFYHPFANMGGHLHNTKGMDNLKTEEAGYIGMDWSGCL